MKIFTNLVVGLILIVLVFPFILVYSNTHPPRYSLDIPPSRFNAEYEAVTFKSQDGTDLKGWLVKPRQPGPPSPAIIICHGLGANKSDFTELAVALSARGYKVLLFDFRAHGDSSGSSSSLGLYEQEDIFAAIGFLQLRPDIDQDRIGIYGFSMGGSAAILAAARSQLFYAIVADSPFASLRDQSRTVITRFYHLPSFPFFHLAMFGYAVLFQASADNVSPEHVVSDISPAPLLVIAADGDELMPVENGRRVFAAAREPKELWILPGTEHGSTLAFADGKYENRVGRFFDKHLPSGQGK
jgi:dipeptidyl aminopeptidase/acylaminoacyl peptidase